MNRSIQTNAIENRKNLSPPENKIWFEVLSRKQTGYKFLRQHHIGHYIPDFYCRELKLIIEIDDDSHSMQKEYDSKRTAYFKNKGITEIRFTNRDIMNNIEGVKEVLYQRISRTTPSVPLLKKWKVRAQTTQVKVANVLIGADNPIVVQSMTNTDTADVMATVQQCAELSNAGSELVRITVNTDAAAEAVPRIVDQLEKMNLDVPLVGDFHFNGHKLLSKHPDCAQALAKYRINPGNIGRGNSRDDKFAQLIDIACTHDKAVRIGVNWGSLDQELMAQMMDQNNHLSTPRETIDVMHDALITSALASAQAAEKQGLAHNKVILSCKMSGVQDLIKIYQDLSQRCDYALHLGLTEAGMGSKGIVASTAALSVLLQQGIGDTIRISLTPEPGAPREKEVQVAQEILQSLELRSFTPTVIACPGCGRTSSDTFQHLTKDIQAFLKQSMPTWKTQYQGVEKLSVAVMGCVVNGPGESKHADIGISLPGNGEKPVAPVYEDGVKTVTLKGDNIAKEFEEIVLKYIKSHY